MCVTELFIAWCTLRMVSYTLYKIVDDFAHVGKVPGIVCETLSSNAYWVKVWFSLDETINSSVD